MARTTAPVTVAAPLLAPRARSSIRHHPNAIHAAAFCLLPSLVLVVLPDSLWMRLPRGSTPHHPAPSNRRRYLYAIWLVCNAAHHIPAFLLAFPATCDYLRILLVLTRFYTTPAADHPPGPACAHMPHLQVPHPPATLLPPPPTHSARWETDTFPHMGGGCGRLEEENSMKEKKK